MTERRATSSSLGEIRVEKLIPGGQGYAKASDGRVVLLRAVVPGDVVVPRRSVEHRGYVEIPEWRLEHASPDRVAPVCSVAERCGGCDWMMLNDDTQRRNKLALVREALARTGKIFELPNELELVAGERRLEYRSRIRLQTGTTGEVGFYSALSHALVEAPTCAVSEPLVNQALARLREQGKAHANGLSAFAHVEIRSANDGTITLHFTGKTPDAKHEPGASALLAELTREFVVSVDRAPHGEHGWQRFPLLDETYLLAPPGSFTQVNWEVNQRLIAALIAGARRRKLRSFADLYCGNGNFTLPLLASGLSGAGVESNPVSITAARRAAALQQLPHDAFFAANAEEIATVWAASGRRYDLVLIDPPRAGVKSGLASMARLASRFIALCSCNPVTLARDLKHLIGLGFELRELTAFDMFPQTHHVEVLAWLERASASGEP